MKTFIALAVFCLIASAFADHELTEEEKAKVKVYFDECVKEENVPEEDVTKLHNKDYTNPSTHMKCFSACLFEKVGTLKDGVLQEDVVLEKWVPHYGEEKVKAAIEKCKDIKGDDRCDTSYKTFDCFQKFKAEMAH